MFEKRLLAEAKVAQFALRLTVLMGVLNGVLIILSAFFLSRVINRVFLEGQTLPEVGEWLALFGLVVVLRGAANWIGSTAARHVAVKVKARLRQRVMAHLFALGPTYTRGERAGELVNTATEGIEQLDAYYADYIPAIYNLLVPLIILFVVLPVDVLTFFVLVVTGPLIPVFMALIGMIAGRVARSQYAAMSRMSAHFLDVMQGLTTLKLFNRAERQTQTINKITDEFREATMRVLRVAFLSSFWLELLATVSIAIVAVEIGLRLLSGNIPFEQALFLLVLAPDYYLPLRQLGVQFHASTEGKAAAERIYAILEIEAPDTSGTKEIPALKESIHIEDVHFAYTPERIALSGASLTLKAGERLALVGRSGAGKSTLAALLLRFIVPQAGTLTVDGVDITTLDAHAWRQSLAYVPQTPYLFNQSIADNICAGKPDADDAAVIAAAQKAGAHDFITTLPDGYQTIAGERGARLSGGQAQRIAIARAFLRDAPLLILDEATSSLDPQAEAIVEDALNRLMVGRTTLIIAHRLTTVYRADQIAVLDAGRVVQVGKHADLMAQGGLYQELVAAYGERSVAP
jgi:ATP-binding cassette, subfamily C, bacterial CydD